MMDASAGPDVKSRLLTATEELLLEQRPVTLPTMRAIAARAGVTPGAAYRHFDSQDDLINTSIATVVTGLEEELLALSMTAANPTEALAVIAEGYVRWGLANRGTYQLIFEAVDDTFDFADGDHPGHSLLLSLAAIVGAIREEDEPNLAVALRVWTYLHGSVSLRTHRAEAPWMLLPPTDLATTVTALATL